MANAQGLQFAYEVISKTAGTARLPKHTNYLRCPKEYTEKLKELRYSINTLNVYTESDNEFKTQSVDNDYLFWWPTHKRTYQLKDKRH